MGYSDLIWVLGATDVWSGNGYLGTSVFENADHESFYANPCLHVKSALNTQTDTRDCTATPYMQTIREVQSSLVYQSTSFKSPL